MEKRLKETFNYSAEDARFMRDEALAAFRKWDAKDDKVRY